MKIRPAHRLPLLLAALAMALVLLAAGSVALVAATLEPAERDAVAALLASRTMLVVMLWLVVFGAAAWAVRRVFERFVEAPYRLAEQAQVLLAGKEARELQVQGSAANRTLAETLNALAQQRTRLRDDVALQIAQASRGVEQERSRLSALMAELTQSVVVCNLDGRILLYNHQARAQAVAWSRTPATAGGAELVGLGRSIHALFERELLAHALESIRERARAGAAQPSAQFVTSTGSGRLLRVQMAAVHEPAAPGEGHAAEPALNGYVLMLDDITREFEQEALRDRLLLGLTEGSRASLGNLQAAVEMLELPDLEPPMRERFQRVVRDEVGAMTARVQTLAADVLAGMKTRWPMEDMLGADLVAAGVRRIETLGAVRVSASEVDAGLWLKVDSYSLLQALSYLAGRLVDEYDVRALRLRLQPAGARAQLDLVWAGTGLSTETVMNWQIDAMRSGADATPLTLRDVVERHGGEFWFERERVRHESFFRFLLPCSAAAEAGPAAPIERGESRPEFYDFDLFQSSAHTRALDERLLAELTCTVFDTETTGLSPSDGDEIIQIGATRIVNGKLLRHESFEQLVDPQRTLAAASIAVHGIGPEALRGQPTILEVLPVFHTFAAETVLVAHNAAFDMRFLQMKEAQSGLRFDHPVLDTLLLSAWLHPNQESHRLEAIAERLAVAVTGRHTALGDALVTAEVFLKLVPLLQARGVRTLGEARAASQQTYQARLAY
ncbi:MAG: exonuclease domain-containing protein [Burkholderiaceae bacterium]